MKIPTEELSSESSSSCSSDSESEVSELDEATSSLLFTPSGSLLDLTKAVISTISSLSLSSAGSMFERVNKSDSDKDNDSDETTSLDSSDADNYWKPPEEPLDNAPAKDQDADKVVHNVSEADSSSDEETPTPFRMVEVVIVDKPGPTNENASVSKPSPKNTRKGKKRRRFHPCPYGEALRHLCPRCKYDTRFAAGMSEDEYYSTSDDSDCSLDYDLIKKSPFSVEH